MARKQSTKRESANLRLRVGFLERATRQVQELAEVIRESPDVDTRESVAADLDRLSRTAGGVSLGEVALTARSAASTIRKGGGPEVLAGLARSLRSTGVLRPRLRPLFVVAHLADVSNLADVARRLVEPVHFFETIADAELALTGDDPCGLVAPIDVLAQADILRDVPGCCLVAYSRDRKLASHQAAVAAGADVFVERLDLSRVADVVRRHNTRTEFTPRQVLMVAPEDKERARLVSALGSVGTVLATDRPAGLALALDEVFPDMVLIDGRVEGAVELVRIVRVHPTQNAVPVLVTGVDDQVPYLDAGADVALPSLQVATVTTQLALDLRRSEGRDRRTGLSTRASALRTLDAMVHHVRRSGEPLVVGVVIVDHIEAITAAYGASAAHRAVAMLAGALRGGLRPLDLVGQLSSNAFIVGLPSCDLAVAELRLQKLRSQFLSGCRSDQRLKEVDAVWGLACSEDGVDDVAVRADASAQRALAVAKG